MTRTDARTRRGSTRTRAKPARRAPARRSAAPELPLELTGAAGLEAYRWSSEELERALLTDRAPGVLEDYFGASNYEELRSMAQEASRTRRRGGPRVLILPGIMGSTLAGKTSRGFTDTIWFDPIDIARGGLAKLALDAQGRSRLRPAGVILLTYLKLKLSLILDGYDADFFPYDWRLPIETSADALLRRLSEEPSRTVDLVAHSMGGLVARAAIGRGGDGAASSKIRRLVMLGTPNHGSFAPVQALRATYDVVQTLDRLDRRHDAAWLAREVFSGFPGLCQMLPSVEKFTAVALLDVAAWPVHGGRPRPGVLQHVAPLQRLLAPGDARMTLIAGVGQATTIAARIENDAFVFELSQRGDGTVPLDYAELSGVDTYYVEEKHGSLPNNRRVARAVADVLDRGKTKRLAVVWEPPPGANTFVVETDMVRARAPETSRALSQRELRSALEPFAAPDAREEGPLPTDVGPAAVISPLARPGYGHTFQHVTVGRRTLHRLDIELVRGSITGVNCRAYVLGVFPDVQPSGAARAIDALTDGAVQEMSMRRMFHGAVGEIFILPTGRTKVPADVVLFAGLGSFDRFGPEVQQVVAENVIRTLVRTHVEEFATVLWGGASGGGAGAALQNLLVGFIRGLTDVDHRQSFRRIILCEREEAAFQDMKQEFLRLATTDLCKEVEFTFDERIVHDDQPSSGSRTIAILPDPVYLIVREEEIGPPESKRRAVKSALLTAGAKATVLGGTKDFDAAAFDKLAARLDGNFREPDLARIGEQVAGLMLDDSVRELLGRCRDRHVVVVHDAATGRVPWETLHIDGWFPAADAGMSHRHLAENLSVAKWLEQRKEDGTLDLLLVVDPTEDLAGARAEGEMVQRLFSDKPNVRLNVLEGADATRPALLSEMRSGKYDVLHYAGHAFFSPERPETSGLYCARGEVLSGADLAGVGNLPALVFFNACESGRLRRPKGEAAPAATAGEPTRAQRVQIAAGLAESFLRGGVANYVGTYWPVGDAAAETFAGKFYEELLGGTTINQATQSARAVVRALQPGAARDWADYIHFGHRDFVLKSF